MVAFNTKGTDWLYFYQSMPLAQIPLKHLKPRKAPSVLINVKQILLHQIPLSREFPLDVFQRGNLRLRFLQIQSIGIIAVKLLYLRPLGITLGEVLIVVQVAVISRHAIEIPHVDGLGTFFLREQRLIHLLTMANTYHLDVVLGRASACRRPLMPEQLTHRLSLSLNGTRRSLLHEDVTIFSVLRNSENNCYF